jgi:hypothetical protein
MLRKQAGIGGISIEQNVLVVFVELQKLLDDITAVDPHSALFKD